MVFIAIKTDIVKIFTKGLLVLLHIGQMMIHKRASLVFNTGLSYNRGGTNLFGGTFRRIKVLNILPRNFLQYFFRYSEKEEFL